MKKKNPFGEALFGKKRFKERMKGVLYIKFKGEKYLLVGDLITGGAITTKEAYANFNISYAHLCSDGKIRRYQEVIGTKDDIEVIK